MTTVEDYRRQLEHVHGWLRPECALLVSRMAESQEVTGGVAEIGVHHGKFFILLALLRRKGEPGLAIDLFEHQDLNTDASGSGDRSVFERHLQEFAAQTDVTVISADSTTVTSTDVLKWADTPGFRLFSVDGGHTAEITASDMACGAGALAEGGILILDDYYNEVWPGVSEGANRFLATGAQIVGIGTAHGKSFFTTSAEYADRYRQVMRDVGAAELWIAGEKCFFGHPHVVLQTGDRRHQLRARAEIVAHNHPVAERLARRVLSVARS